MIMRPEPVRVYPQRKNQWQNTETAVATTTAQNKTIPSNYQNDSDGDDDDDSNNDS